MNKKLLWAIVIALGVLATWLYLRGEPQPLTRDNLVVKTGELPQPEGAPR